MKFSSKRAMKLSGATFGRHLVATVRRFLAKSFPVVGTGTSPGKVTLPHFQAPNRPVLVGRWSADEDFTVHPVGSKPKRMLICPADSNEPYLIPNHAYLFKIAEGWRAQQMW